MASNGTYLAAEIAEMAEGVSGLPQLRRAVLDRLQSVIGCETVFWGHRSCADVRSSMDVYSGPHGQARESLERYAAARERYDIPELSQIVRATNGVFVDVEVLSAAQREALPLYVDVLRPAGIRTYLACDIAFRQNPMSFLALCRHGRGARFGMRDKDVLRAAKNALGIAEAAFGALATTSAPHEDRLVAYGLSRREAEIAKLVLRGLQNKEIAALLGTSPNTVRKQTVRIYEKAGVSGRSQLVARLHSVAESDGPRARETAALE
jgi:DNA-binding CsgD family transcriptional regulator